MNQRARRFVFPWTKTERFVCTKTALRHHSMPLSRASHPQEPLYMTSGARIVLAPLPSRTRREH